MVTCDNVKFVSTFGSSSAPPSQPKASVQQYFSVLSTSRGSWGPRTLIPAPDLYAGPNPVGLNPPLTLPDGDVFLGRARFDAATRAFLPTGSPGFATCGQSMAVLIAEGRVLLAGGGRTVYHSAPTGPSATCNPTPQAAVFNPSTDTWASTAPMRVGVFAAAATELPDGGAFLAGGIAGNRLTRATQVYDPRRDRWVSGPELPEALSAASAVTLRDGRVLIMGGFSLSGPQRRAFFFVPATGALEPAPSMLIPRGEFSATITTGGDVVVAGGESIDGHGQVSPGVRDVEVFSPTAGVWRRAAPLPSALASPAIATSSSTMFALPRGRVFFATLFGGDAIGTPGA